MTGRRRGEAASRYYTEIGARLRKCRQDCGVSQTAVARLLGLPRPAVSKIEAGERAISTYELVRLAGFYERHPSEFL